MYINRRDNYQIFEFIIRIDILINVLKKEQHFSSYSIRLSKLVEKESTVTPHRRLPQHQKDKGNSSPSSARQACPKLLRPGIP